VEVNKAREDKTPSAAQDGAIPAETGGAGSGVGGNGTVLKKQKAAVAIRRSVLASSTYARRTTTWTQQNVASQCGGNL
jgi:hypothetical protein